MPDSRSTVTRDELYELVWAQPMVKVAACFGVSGSYLARVCSNLNIPRPQRGYWAKLAVGKAPKARALPPALPGDEVTWTPGTALAEVMRSTTASTQDLIKRRGDVAPGGDDHREHLLIREARAHFECTDVTSRIGFLKPAKRNLPDIVVGRTLLAQALTLANKLYLALERRGYRVLLGSPSEGISRPEFDPREFPNKQNFYDNHRNPWRHTLVYVKGTPIGIILYELTEATVLHYVNGEYLREADFRALKRRIPEHMTWTTTNDILSGRFGLILYSSFYDRRGSHCWKESKPGKLGGKVLELVRQIEAFQPEAQRILDEGRARHEQSLAEWALIQERRKEEEIERHRQKAIADSTTELLQLIQAFDRADSASNAIRRLTLAARKLEGAERKRFEVLLSEARKILGPEPDIKLFLEWKPPGDRS